MGLLPIHACLAGHRKPQRVEPNLDTSREVSLSVHLGITKEVKECHLLAGCGLGTELSLQESERPEPLPLLKYKILGGLQLTALSQ